MTLFAVCVRRFTLLFLLGCAAASASGASRAPADTSRAATQERLLRAQVLLDRLHLSPGEIDGAKGANLRQALLAFQSLRALDASGELDDASWTALNEDASPTLADYTISAEDVAGPFRALPSSMQAKSRLPHLSYQNALEGLGEKFHASPALLMRLNPGQDFKQAGSTIKVPNVLDAPALLPAARIAISDSRKVLMLYDAADRLIAQYPVSTGSSRDPLPLGEWTVTQVYPNPTYHYNPKLFWDARPGDRKAIIKPGPNNPVGVVWINLSKPHLGIHGTPLPAQIGKTTSHGCIRLTNWSALEVASAIAADTPVLMEP